MCYWPLWLWCHFTLEFCLSSTFQHCFTVAASWFFDIRIQFIQLWVSSDCWYKMGDLYILEECTWAICYFSKWRLNCANLYILYCLQLENYMSLPCCSLLGKIKWLLCLNRIILEISIDYIYYSSSSIKRSSSYSYSSVVIPELWDTGGRPFRMNPRSQRHLITLHN